MILRDPDNPLFDGNNPPIPEVVHAQIAAMGREFSQQQTEEAYQRVQNLYELKMRIYPEEIEAIADEIHIQPKIGWDLVSIMITIGPNVLPAAKVILNSPDGKRISSEAGGDSSTDAICSAISEATEIRTFLKDFEFHTISGGTKSLGQAKATVEYHNQQVRTTACSVDMLEAAAKAYLIAINIVLDRI
ncbi:MAG: alpha-isopropylmalate synthase regulatory domain-containing protein, partial [Phycisphaerae bacterium]|nr:alpha-isopropylmalate synthase regulatory domain-containing protein [Phycisphaerae bacterium]